MIILIGWGAIRGFGFPFARKKIAFIAGETDTAENCFSGTQLG